MNILDEIGREQVKTEVPEFNVGDTVRVHFRIVEGEKERIQVFEGVVISRKGGVGPLARFTVRRVAYNEGVERVFPLHSPRVEKVEVIRAGKVRRAKLHYLRERAGKAARVKAVDHIGGHASRKKAAPVIAPEDPIEEPDPVEAEAVAPESTPKEKAKE